MFKIKRGIGIFAGTLLLVFVFIGAFALGFILVKAVSDRGIDAAIEAYAAENGNDGGWEEDLGMAVRNAGKSRSQSYSFVELGQSIFAGDIVDIRIAFPNGADYVVLGKKEIEDVSDDGIVIVSTEEDVLKMASAKVDMEQYQGCRVYVGKYVDGDDAASICNYPVRKDVQTLYGWDPNVGNTRATSEVAGYAYKRTELENALAVFFDE